MLRSRKILSAIRWSLVLVSMCLVLNADAKPDPDGVVCGPDSGGCGGGSEAARVQPVVQLAQLRGRRSASAEEFWKRSYPLWQRRYRSGTAAWLSPDDVMSRSFKPSSVKDKGDAFWKRVDPQGFWRRTAADTNEEEDTRKAEDGHRNAEEVGLDTGKRLDRLVKEDSPAEPDEGVAAAGGYPNKQRRRQEALTRPEFNPTGW